MEILEDMHHVKSLKSLVALGLVLALCAGQEAWAAQQQEEDSVYRWGRWAVLSPAAGGDSYEGSETPDAANNARPSDASAFQPEIASVGVPPVQPPIQPPVQPPVTLPPVVVANPPGALPPIGDGRVRPPGTQPGTQPPIGDGRQR